MRDIIVEREKKGMFDDDVWQLKVNNKVVATLRNGKSITLSADPKKQYTIQCCYEKAGFLGGHHTIISDIVNIPANNKDYKLLASSVGEDLLLEIEDEEE